MPMSTVSMSQAVAPGAKTPQRILSLWFAYLATDRLQRDARGLTWRVARRSGETLESGETLASGAPPIAIVATVT